LNIALLDTNQPVLLGKECEEAAAFSVDEAVMAINPIGQMILVSPCEHPFAAAAHEEVSEQRMPFRSRHVIPFLPL
jgi:hypothetical protein